MWLLLAISTLCSFQVGLLRVHGTGASGHLQFSLENHWQTTPPFDVGDSIIPSIVAVSSVLEYPTLTLKTRPTTVFRAPPAAVERARLRSLHLGQNEAIDWREVSTTGPDVGDIRTLSQLARMAANAYAVPGQSNWYDMDQWWNIVSRTH